MIVPEALDSLPALRDSDSEDLLHLLPAPPSLPGHGTYRLLRYRGRNPGEGMGGLLEVAVDVGRPNPAEAAVRSRLGFDPVRLDPAPLAGRITLRAGDEELGTAELPAGQRVAGLSVHIGPDTASLLASPDAALLAVELTGSVPCRCPGAMRVTVAPEAFDRPLEAPEALAPHIDALIADGLVQLEAEESVPAALPRALAAAALFAPAAGPEPWSGVPTLTPCGPLRPRPRPTESVALHAGPEEPAGLPVLGALALPPLPPDGLAVAELPDSGLHRLTVIPTFTDVETVDALIVDLRLPGSPPRSLSFAPGGRKRAVLAWAVPEETPSAPWSWRMTRVDQDGTTHPGDWADGEAGTRVLLLADRMHTHRLRLEVYGLFPPDGSFSDARVTLDVPGQPPWTQVLTPEDPRETALFSVDGPDRTYRWSAVLTRRDGTTIELPVRSADRAVLVVPVQASAAAPDPA